MRWPWQRERPEPGPEASAPEVEAHAAPDSANRAPVPPAGWAFLPPLQRTIGTMDLAHGPDRFAGSLAAWANPSFTGPMSHLVTADAPPGVIDVDGGGTGTGEAYRSEPADLTLLIPPARSRPAGGLPTAVQRTSSADDAPYGASSGAGVPDDIGVLHVEAVPTPAAKQTPEVDFQPRPEHGTASMQRPSGGPQAPTQPMAPVQRSASGAQPSPPQPQAAQHQAVRPQTAESAQTALPEGDADVTAYGAPQAAEWPTSGWDTVAPTRPDSAGSTSDGNATYVPLPVQRVTDRGPDAPPAAREATPFTYPSRLGLGRPLSFSQPESSERPRARVSDVPEPLWPVQRVHEPGPSAVAAPAPPELSVAEALKAPDSPSAQSIQATDAAGHGDARNNGDAPSQGGADNATAVRDHEGPAEQQPSPPPAAESSAALLSDALSSAPTPPSVDSGRERITLQSAHTNRAADLPVVSRLAADKHLDNDGGTTLRETAASLLQPDDPHHEVPADNSGPAAGAIEPDRPSTSAPDDAPVLSRGLLGEERADGLPAQSGVPVQAGIPGHGRIAAQRDTGDGWPGGTRSAAVQESAAVAGRVPGANGTPRAGTGAMQGLESAGPTQSDTLSGATVQRADQAAVGTAAQWSASRAGTADVRASRPVTPGSTPLTWQRMAAMPPAVQQRPAGDTRPAFQAGAGTAASMAFGVDATGRTDAHSATDATGAGEPDRVSTDFLTEPDTVHQTVPALQSEPEYGGPDLREVTEPPGPSAAVGSVIQRTVTLDMPTAQAPDGSPSPGMPFRADRATRPSPGSGAQALQRMPVFPGSVPVRAARYPVPADLAGTAGQPVVHSAAQYPVALRLAPAAEPVMDGPTTQGDDLIGAVQRDSLPGSPDAAAPPAAAPATAPPEVSGASSAVEANSEEPPVGPAAPAPGRSAGAPGVPGAATPDQLEELAKRLAGPLIRRIKAEMLLDRERRGLRTDSN